VGLAARDPARGEHLAFSVPFLEVDNGYVAVAGSALRHAEEVDRPGIRVAVAEGSAPDGVLTRNLRAATLVRVPGGQEAARAALTEGRADVYGENVHLAHRIAETLPGTRVLEGRFNLVLMSIAVPKSEAEQAMPAINAFVAEALRDGLVARLIAEAGLRGVRLPA
jgi:polar amino acid transport system substrate-binding protein